MEKLWFYTTRKDTWVISMITSPWVFLFLSAILKQCLRLGRGCVELHYGSALEDEFWPIILWDLVIPSNIRKKTHSAIRHYTNPAVRLKPDQPAPKCPEYVYSELFAFACIPWFDALSSSIGSSHGRVFWQHLTLFDISLPSVTLSTMVVFIMPTRHCVERIQFGSPNHSGENDRLWWTLCD